MNTQSLKPGWEMVNAENGAAIAEQLSNDLRTEFPGISGFSRRNVFYMREFYLLYRDDKRVQPLVAQIGWTHNLVISQRCKDPLEREFYIRMPRKFGWSKTEGAIAPAGIDRGLA